MHAVMCGLQLLQPHISHRCCRPDDHRASGTVTMRPFPRCRFRPSFRHQLLFRS